MNEVEVFDFLKKTLMEFFEIPEEKIQMHSKLFDDLEIDSIDAIDLIDHIKKQMGYQLVPNDFKEARTIEDIIKIVMAKQQEL